MQQQLLVPKFCKLGSDLVTAATCPADQALASNALTLNMIRSNEYRIENVAGRAKISQGTELLWALPYAIEFIYCQYFATVKLPTSECRSEAIKYGIPLGFTQQLLPLPLDPNQPGYFIKSFRTVIRVVNEPRESVASTAGEDTPKTVSAATTSATISVHSSPEEDLSTVGGEARIWHSLHPTDSIIYRRTYEIYGSQAAIYITVVMPFIPNVGSLDKVVLRDTVQLQDMVRQLLTQVLFLHSKNILHCDLKPQNILLGRDGKVHIVDFGASVFLGEALNSAWGTAGYSLYLARYAGQVHDYDLSGSVATKEHFIIDYFAVGKTILALCANITWQADSTVQELQAIGEVLSCSDGKQQITLEAALAKLTTADKENFLQRNTQALLGITQKRARASKVAEEVVPAKKKTTSVVAATPTTPPVTIPLLPLRV